MARVSVDTPADDSKLRESRQQARLRAFRLKRRLTQARLAELSGVHRNTIVKLENGKTREVLEENATALAAVLNASVDDLGLVVRPSGKPRSIRIREMTPEQRAIVDDLLSLPPADYAVIRSAIEQLRSSRRKKKRRRGTRS